MPRLVDLACGAASAGPWKIATVAGLSGRTVEIGFASGPNLEYFGGNVDVGHAVQSAPGARRPAERRHPPGGIEVVHLVRDTQFLNLEDARCEGALSTFTLWVIPDVVTALAGLRRVPRPGGRFQFLEQGSRRM
ncbi:MAG TPA: methyltransferase domain-containing protein [Acidimicrobiales bacterium]|nr:methyltransferase domain-containing protein [Acidimicrobiales bacterium]